MDQWMFKRQTERYIRDKIWFQVSELWFQVSGSVFCRFNYLIYNLYVQECRHIITYIILTLRIFSNTTVFAH